MKKEFLFLAIAALAFASCSKDATPLVATENVIELPPTPFYTIKSHDGHLIGINGEQPVANPKVHTDEVMGCGAASNLTVNAVSNFVFTNGSLGCALVNMWTVAGGKAEALYINGQPYIDPTTGYGLWNPAINGIVAEMHNGILGGTVFNDFIRTYCNADTTGSPYFDSPVCHYVVDTNFVCDPSPPKHHSRKTVYNNGTDPKDPWFDEREAMEISPGCLLPGCDKAIALLSHSYEPGKRYCGWNGLLAQARC